jgi:hypothetical protein
VQQTPTPDKPRLDSTTSVLFLTIDRANGRGNETSARDTTRGKTRQPRIDRPHDGCIVGNGPAESLSLFSSPKSSPGASAPPLSPPASVCRLRTALDRVAHCRYPRPRFNFAPSTVDKMLEDKYGSSRCYLSCCHGGAGTGGGAVLLTLALWQVHRSGASHDLKLSHWYACASSPGTDEMRDTGTLTISMTGTSFVITKKVGHPTRETNRPCYGANRKAMQHTALSNRADHGFIDYRG